MLDISVWNITNSWFNYCLAVCFSVWAGVLSLSCWKSMTATVCKQKTQNLGLVTTRNTWLVVSACLSWQACPKLMAYLRSQKLSHQAWSSFSSFSSGMWKCKMSPHCRFYTKFCKINKLLRELWPAIRKFCLPFRRTGRNIFLEYWHLIRTTETLYFLGLMTSCILSVETLVIITAWSSTKDRIINM